MIPLAISLIGFAFFWLVGTALLSLLYRSATPLRAALVAPALGVVVVACVAFLLSDAGMAAAVYAFPLVVTAAILSGAALVWKRPPIDPSAYAVLAVSVAVTAFFATPALHLGLNWIANANADMGAYSLSAQQIIHHGLFSTVEPRQLRAGTDYSASFALFHLSGNRPGFDLLLAASAVVTRHLPYQVYMPLTMTITMCGVWAAGALAAAWSDRRWAPTLAALCLGLSAYATYGSLQELTPQVAGLAMATALFAILLRDRSSRDAAWPVSDCFLLSLFGTGVLLTYTEFLPILAGSVGIYLTGLLRNRKVSLGSVARLGLWTIGLSAVVLNRYLPKAASFFLSTQVGHGLNGQAGSVNLFGYALTPAQLAASVGLVPLDPNVANRSLPLWIAVGAGVLVLAVVWSALRMLRGELLASIYACLALLSILLVLDRSSFGLFKLGMYAQPFLAVGAAFLICGSGQAVPSLRLALAVAMAGLLVAQVPTDVVYLRQSRNPGAVPDASSSSLFPNVRHIIDSAAGPVVIASDNPEVIELDEAAGYGHQVRFIGREGGWIGAGSETGAATSSSLRFRLSSTLSDTFSIDPLAEAALSDPRCTIVLPTGHLAPVNGYPVVATTAAVRASRCDSTRNTLVIQDSDLGEPYYPSALTANSWRIGLFQPQPDPVSPHQTMSAVGQYALFQVLNPSTSFRVEMDFSASYLPLPDERAMPMVSVIGANRVSVPYVGYGSGRVISPPVRPQMIDGRAYIMLAFRSRPFGDGQTPTGVDALFGPGQPVNDRMIEGYLRNLSIVPVNEADPPHPPDSADPSPAGLANPALLYSGIYEDGWVGAESEVVLSGGPATNLVVQGQALVSSGQTITLAVNRRVVFRGRIKAGSLMLRIPLAPSLGPRNIQLQFGRTETLPAPDGRVASAHLTLLRLSG